MHMAKRYNLGAATAIPHGEGRNYKVGNQLVAVFHTRDGSWYATQATCPHRQGPLADGLTGGNTLVCPLHEWTFDLTTGKAQNGSCNLAVYPIARAPSGELLLDLPGEHDTN